MEQKYPAMKYFSPHPSQLNPAESAYERLEQLAADFEKALDDEHEFEMRIAPSGGANAYRVQDIGYWGPDILIFYCVEESGAEVRLIQHYTKLDILMRAVSKNAHRQEQAARRIGFVGELAPQA